MKLYFKVPPEADGMLLRGFLRRCSVSTDLSRVHPAVGQHGRAVGKKAAALKFDCPGKLRRNGTLAQKIAHKHAVLRLRHGKFQLYMPHPLCKKYMNIIPKNASTCKSCFFMVS